MMEVFESLESQVRSYCRAFPTVFSSAKGHRLWDESRRRSKDSSAVASDGVTHSLDMATEAKRDFLETFHRLVLAPRGMDYRVMFPGPTGTNSVEAALKLARTVTGRSNVVAFTNAFHGMTLGSLALTGNGGKRDGAGVTLTDVT